MSELRILHVINRISPSGGAEVSLGQLLPRLAARGVQQGLVTLKPNTAPDVMALIRAAGVSTYDAGGVGTATSTRGVVRAVRDFAPDVMACSLYESNRAARLAGALTRTPVLCAVVNTPYGREAVAAARSPWKLRVVALSEGLLARHLTTGFHALTEAAASEAVSRLRIDPAAVTVVPRGRSAEVLGTPEPQRRARVRAGLGLDDRALVVLNVARQEVQKGQVQLVEAFEVLHRHDPDAVLLVAGRVGAATPTLEARVAASPARKQIRLLGLRDDVGELLGAADVFAFSSLWEGLGGSVLEAMCCSVPVVTYDVPAVTEVLGGCGRVVPLGDPRALGSALVELAQDPEERASLAERARKRFLEQFELEAVVERMAAMYADTASGRCRSRGGRAARADD